MLAGGCEVVKGKKLDDVAALVHQKGDLGYGTGVCALVLA